MLVKNIVDEDFANYKECAMFIGFPHCTFKCEKDCGCTGMCQNASLVKSPSVDVSIEAIISRYISNPLSRALVCGGLEPFDSPVDLEQLIVAFRKACDDPIIIYTGYYKEELESAIEQLQRWSNIIIKFGRFIPNQSRHFDPVLGVTLASDNQYAERIS